MAVHRTWPFQITILLVTMVPSLDGPYAGAQERTLNQLNKLVEESRLSEAAQLAQQIGEKSNANADFTLALARLARSLQREGKLELSADIYQQIVESIDPPQGADLPVDTRIALRLAAGSGLVKSTMRSAAILAVAPLLQPSEEVITQQQRRLAVSICLQVGGQALAARDHAVAGKAYALALKHADDSQRPMAMLGDAWSSAMDSEQPEISAKKLSGFVESYPNHPDAPNAARQSIESFRLANDHSAAEAATKTLLDQWPDSAAAVRVAHHYDRQPIESVPKCVQDWLLQMAVADDLESLDGSLSVLAIHAASIQNESAAWSSLIRHLASVDQTGRSTSRLLTILPEAEAERAATALILTLTQVDESADNRIATESAVRWAAGKERWAMLAAAADDLQLAGLEKNCTVDAQKLFAESLMQMGQVESSIRWWNHLVDVRAVDDFPTLLRCAEAETASGRDLRLAKKRIDDARRAAGEDRVRIALADLLDAELKVRGTKFDEARQILQRVASEQGGKASIRARAQWVTGETYYLQHRFGEAIDAYRRVEEIVGDDQAASRSWIAAALVQAGKSFEQLGRTREAALCYGNLLDRFPDSAHAWLANQRMAVLEPQQRPGDAPDSSQTIRR